MKYTLLGNDGKFVPKFADFIKNDCKVEMLEGTTFAGKTTIAFNVKFVYKVLKSSFKKHLIALSSIA